jgi:hypothetical protein
LIKKNSGGPNSNGKVMVLNNEKNRKQFIKNNQNATKNTKKPTRNKQITNEKKKEQQEEQEELIENNNYSNKKENNSVHLKGTEIFDQQLQENNKFDNQKFFPFQVQNQIAPSIVPSLSNVESRPSYFSEYKIGDVVYKVPSFQFIPLDIPHVDFSQFIPHIDPPVLKLDVNEIMSHFK